MLVVDNYFGPSVSRPIIVRPQPQTDILGTQQYVDPNNVVPLIFLRYVDPNIYQTQIFCSNASVQVWHRNHEVADRTSAR